MARNQEKAQSMLSRFRAVQAAEAGHPLVPQQKRRPHFPREDMSLYDCEQYRLDCVREISRKVSQIQNATIGEHRIRELNEMINRLLKEKANWERHIKEMGGPDHRAKSAALEADGAEAPGMRGYKYFGAAKNLPGVRELLEQTEIVVESSKPSRKELQANVDADYYGYRDDDDGELARLEAEMQPAATAKALSEHAARRRQRHPQDDQTEFVARLLREADEADEEKASRDEEATGAAPKKRAYVHVQVPSASDIEEYLVERKKRELLERYAPQDNMPTTA